MKREEILAMVPGPTMNALMADKVMKWGMKIAPFSPSTEISSVWEVEELFKGEMGIRGSYVACLKEVLGPYASMFDFIHATPEQRCKAALLAVLEEE